MFNREFETSKKARKSILTKETVPETSFSRSAQKRNVNTNKGKVVKQEGLQSKLNGNCQQEIPTHYLKESKRT